MHVHRLTRAACCALLLCGASLPVAAALGPQEVPIELVSPRSDVRLVAGEWAQVEWAPRAGFGELRKVEEWEAFLSIDGGAHYAIRLTPHLDRDLRRFN